MDARLRADVQGEVAIPLSNINWTPQGEFAVNFIGGSLALVNPSTGEGFILPATNAVAYGWGATPPLTAEGFFLPTHGHAKADTAPLSLRQSPGSAAVVIQDGNARVLQHNLWRFLEE